MTFQVYFLFSLLFLSLSLCLCLCHLWPSPFLPTRPVVCDGIYQVRNYDVANITFIRGEKGWLVIDPLTSTETAKACLTLVNETLGFRPVTGVIYTHSHADHFGGVKAVVDVNDVTSGKLNQSHRFHLIVIEKKSLRTL
jgi:glyoxylase-like metal-dependent hydrolase (beta-lactamase superfamily II)